MSDLVLKGAAVIAFFMTLRNSLTRGVESFDAYQEKLKALQALTGLSGESLEYLDQVAKKLSVTTTKDGIRIKQSASDILDAFKTVGSQRPELLKNKEALADVAKYAIILSEAGKMDLTPATAAVTNSLNQFNAAASETPRIINAIAAGSQIGAGDIEYLSKAIEKSGTTANMMHVPFEQLIGLIETAAPKFTQADMAGNSIDKLLLKMQAHNIGYTNGVFNMNTALSQLSERFANGELASKIFGEEHAKMANVLVQGQSTFNQFTKDVTGTNQAIEQAIINTDTNAAKTKQAKNEQELLRIELGEKLTPVMDLYNQSLIGVSQLLIKIIPIIVKYKSAIIFTSTAIGIYILSAKLATKWNKALGLSAKEVTGQQMLQTYWSKACALATSLWGNVVGVVTGKIKLATVATRIWNLVLANNPIGWITIALSALVYGIMKFVNYTSQAQAVTNRLNQAQKEILIVP